MLRMMQDDLERKQKQSQEDKRHQSVEDSQVNEDMMERSVSARIKVAAGRDTAQNTVLRFRQFWTNHCLTMLFLNTSSILCTVEPLTFFFRSFSLIVGSLRHTQISSSHGINLLSYRWLSCLGSHGPSISFLVLLVFSQVYTLMLHYISPNLLGLWHCS